VREVEFRLEGDTLLHAGERRALTEADWARFADWIRQYHDVCWLPHIQAKLLDLGRQIHDWLNGPERWLGKLGEIPDAPVIAEFAPFARGRTIRRAAFSKCRGNWLPTQPAISLNRWM
jgi:hypothetical protein